MICNNDIQNEWARTQNKIPLNTDHFNSLRPGISFLSSLKENEVSLLHTYIFKPTCLLEGTELMVTDNQQQMGTAGIKGLCCAAKMMCQALRGAACVILPLRQQHSQKAAMQSSWAEHHQRSQWRLKKKKEEKNHIPPLALPSAF